MKLFILIYFSKSTLGNFTTAQCLINLPWTSAYFSDLLSGSKECVPVRLKKKKKKKKKKPIILESTRLHSSW
jgi:hypothetical protein